MPVATRSQTLSSPNPVKPGTELDDRNHGTAHMANLRALSTGRLKSPAAPHEPDKRHKPDAIPFALPERRTTHDSVSLLTQRDERHKRPSSMAEKFTEETVFSTNDDHLVPEVMQQRLKTPLINQGIVLNPQISAPLVPFSCPKPIASTDGSRPAVAPGYGFTQTDLKPSYRLRKRSFNEDLETVKEEAEQGTRIMVFVRLRPLSKKEKEAGARSCVRVVNKKDVYLTEFALENDYLRLKRLKGRHFAFDAAFPETTTQLDVYNTSTAELVEAVLEGKNGSVFCYGATGAGKTYTMLGTIQNPGVMVLALKDLFTKLRQRSKDGDYMVHLSYLEVYNETVRDLLSPGRPLVLREDSKQGIVATGLTQYEAYSADEVMQLLQQGNQNRTTEPTRINETSSRSHAILQVITHYKVRQDMGSVSRVGKLSLIDLAGSERALATDQRTLRSLEGANINRSLLALSSCINALVEGKKHIPFRNSKLTQLLKDSLGGACQTAMIANICPSSLSFGETQNTLHWADRAKEIRTKACDAHELKITDSENEQAKVLLEVQQENQQLRLQVAQLQRKLLEVQSRAASQSPISSAAIPSSPYTPTKAAIKVNCQARSPLACRTPEPVSKEDRNADRRTINELRRTVQTLMEEKERIKRESALREEQLRACIAALNREHITQLRHKDGFIRTLCQKNLEDAGSVVPSECLQQPSLPQLKEKASPKSSTVARRMSGVALLSTKKQAATLGAVEMQSERPKRFVSLRVSNKVSLPPHVSAAADTVQRTGRLSQTAHLPPKTPLPRFCSPSKNLASSCRKRTFWDITNANSPGSGRCTRSNTAASATPSMLLQPGFLRGQPSLN